MTILPINPIDPDPDVIVQATRVLHDGGLLVYPTDTCYGIGVDARNERALSKLTEFKGGRDSTKRFSVIARDIQHIAELCLVSEAQWSILANYLPGPFTFILLNTDFQVAQTSTLGVRIPDHAVTAAIANQFKDAYISTSMNRSDQPTAYSVEDIEQRLLDSVDRSLWPDLILDAGALPPNPSSTVVNLATIPYQVLRQGGQPFVWPLADE